MSNQEELATGTAEATTNIKQGNFCWWELATSDQEGAKKFYGALFGWDTFDNPMGPDMIYTTFLFGGKSVGAAYKQDQNQAAMGIPPNWMSYVHANADEVAQKTKAAGGNVIVEPMDVMDFGRMVVIQDPSGAVVGVWQPGTHKGAEHVGGVGGVCWTELATKDAAAAGKFYSTVFGWGLDEQNMEGMKYTMFKNGGSSAGGMMQMTEEWGNIPSHWMPYFTVADTEASCAKIKELGGNVHVQPTDIPGVGRFAVASDPQGAHFSIIKLEGM